MKTGPTPRSSVVVEAPGHEPRNIEVLGTGTVSAETIQALRFLLGIPGIRATFVRLEERAQAVTIVDDSCTGFDELVIGNGSVLHTPRSILGEKSAILTKQTVDQLRKYLSF